MRGTKDGSTPSEPTPAEPSAPSPSNAFASSFLASMNERDEPAAAPEADLAGPWWSEPLPYGRFGIFRTGESRERGHEPKAIFATHALALQAMALLPLLSRGPAYRLSDDPDEQGYALESREEWGAVVGYLLKHRPELIAGLSLLDALARSPYSLALFLESCGKVALEHAGAVLAGRVGGGE